MRIWLKLVMYFVIVSLIVITLNSFMFFIQGSEAIEERVEAQLDSIIALKENLLPPLTTFATRLIWTTFSLRSNSVGFIFSTTLSLLIILEF